MPKLIMLSGLPASGKSTAARKLVEETGNTVRLNRDLLRDMCFNGKWTGPREGAIIDMERAMARQALNSGYNVVVDDTNLKSKTVEMWKHDAEREGAMFVHLPMLTPVAECVARDTKRYNEGRPSVGPAVIYRMAAENGRLFDADDNRPIVICDLDGTLCDVEHRLQLLRKCKHCGREQEFHPAPTSTGKQLGGQHNFAKNWEAFHQASVLDPPRVGILKWVKGLADTHCVILLSGRGDEHQLRTVFWLQQHEVPYFALLMRKSHDHRDDSIVKKEILDLLPRERVAFAIDDRVRVVRMWRENGIKVYDVRDTDKEY